MCRLLCSLLVSLAITDGAVPYLSCTCQHYSQPLENRLLNHQLKQCIDSQSHRLITYCLHNMWCIWALVPKMFSGYATAAATFPPLEDPNPRWHPDTMALPSCPCASIYPQMLQLRTGVCLPKNGKTYWTGTIMQTNEIMDQLGPKKNEALPDGNMAQVTELTPP